MKSSLNNLVVLTFICLGLSAATAQSAQTNLAVIVRHAPSLNGGFIQGSLQQLNGESTAINGGFVMTGDLLLPGTPTLTLNGHPAFAGTLVGSGSASPSDYQIILNGNCSLNYLRVRTTPVLLSTVATPPSPSGTRNVSINQPGQSYGDPATLRNLTLNGNAGMISVPPGAYGTFTLNGGSGLVLGVAGGAQPVSYNLQNLTLNGNATLKVVGPVFLTIANGFSVNGNVGASNNPAWLQLRIANGGVTLNGGCNIYGLVKAPNGTVVVNGNSRLVGTSGSDRFILNGGGSVRWSGAPVQSMPPIAFNQTVTLPENGFTNIILAGSDPQGLTLTYTVLTQPTHGTLTGTPPDLTYQPFTNYFGNDAFTFKANNDCTDSAPATVSLTVTQVYYPPTADTQSLTNLEDTVLAITLSGSDPQGYPLTYVVQTRPAHGILSGTAPNLTYQPTTNYFGNDTFTFLVNDGISNSSIATVNITNMPVDDPPLVVAGPDQLIILPVNTARLSGSVSYDIFPGTVNTVQWSKEDGPGDVTFSDPADAMTTATFSTNGIYRLQLLASDSFLSSSNGVSITVDAPPTVDAGGTLTNTFPGTVSLFGTARDDGLPSNGILNIQWNQVSGPGTVVFDNAAATNSSVTFGTNGIYTLRLTADDGIATNHSDVMVIENLPPLVNAGADILTNGLQAALNGGVSDDGFPGQLLSVLWCQSGGPGTVSFVNASATNATVTASESGTYILTLTATDGAATNLAEVTVTFNLPPVANAGPEQIVNFGTTVSLAGSVTDDQLPHNDLNIVWTEASGSGMAIFADPTMTNSTVTFDQPGIYILRLTANDGMATNSADTVIAVNAAPLVNAGPAQTVTLGMPVTLAGTVTDDGIPGPTVATEWTQASGPASATITDATALNSSVSFSEAGIYTFQLTANDGLTNASAQVTITVQPVLPVNHAPVAQSQAVSAVTNTPLNITLTATDADNDALTFQLLTEPTDGILSGNAPYLVYQPAAGFIGADRFTFVANDGHSDSTPAEVTINVQAPTNSLHLIVPAAQDAFQDRPFTFTNENRITLVGGSAGDSSVLLYLGVTNGTLTLGSTNGLNIVQGPQSTDLLVSGPQDDLNKALDGLIYLGNPFFVGEDTIVASVGYLDDLEPSDVEFVPITVLPSLTFVGPLSGAIEDTPFAISYDDLYWNSDIGDGVSFIVEWLTAGTLTKDGNPVENGTTLISPGDSVVWMPPPGAVGTIAAFQVRAWDGVHLSSNDVPVYVEIVLPTGDHIPAAQPQSLSTIQDTPLNVTLTATDADNDPLTYQVLSQPSNGTLTGDAPNLTYQPAAGFAGSDSFTFVANDGQVDSAPATVNITVNPPILPPGVFAGHSHVLLGTNSVALKGQAAGRNGIPLISTWSVISQPPAASVQFTDVNDPQAIATFNQSGAYQLRLTAEDGLTNASADVYFWVIPNLPPDPATVAPPLDPTEPTCLTKATEFLYTGNNSIQIGVAPGIIVFERAALLHGRILNQQDTGLPGVGITVLGHPEFGATVSRADGRYDLAVNGGAPLTLNFEKVGFPIVQRRADVPWQRYVSVDDVVMTPYDGNTNVIIFNSSGMQLAAGSVVSDADGPRQAVVFFPSGTAAQLVFGGTTTQSVQSLNVRLTEYTVGTNGPEAMPAQLPPNSTYTYCVELSADEAETAEADSVVFSQPVSIYVENFIGFPAGTVVPVGFYDRQRGCWAPSANGRVIAVLANNGGQVTLDVDGADNPATQDELNRLGITSAELAGLAQRYQPGQSLWRVQVSHFTPGDFNWCSLVRLVGPIPDGPQQLPPTVPAPKADDNTDDPCHKKGSDIDVQNQVLGEDVPVTGAPFSLHYSSEMVPGRISSRQLIIPIRDDNTSFQADQIIVEVSVAGEGWRQTLDGASTSPDQTVAYTWDGKDGYGRTVQGEQMAVIKIGYSYCTYYVDYSDNPELIPYFSLLGNIVPFQTWFTRAGAPPVVLWEIYEAPLENWDSRGQGLGGWTLSHVHTYDPETRTLITGDGAHHSALSVNAEVDVLGTNGADFVATGPDGSVFFSNNNGTVERRTLDGDVCLIAGGGNDAPVDGLYATNAFFAWISGLTVGPDSAVYLADAQYNQIWKVAADGRLKLIAGIGSRGYSGDGGPATSAELVLDQMFDPTGMAVAPDFTLFFCDYGNHALRRVGNDGIITTVAGGYATNRADSIPAPQALLNWPAGLAISPEGDIYVGDANGLHVISPNGIISNIPYNDQVVALALGADHSLYINNSLYIDEMKPDGAIVRIAGSGSRDYDTLKHNGMAALQFPLTSSSLAVGQDNRVYFGTGFIFGENGNLCRISLPLPGLSYTNVAISGEDGSELYYFTGTGKHLSTVDTLTGKILYQFGYDANGLLISMADMDGDVTAIQRDSMTGEAMSIVSPDGHTTTLGYDANGWLNRISDPANEAFTMTYTPYGLLTQFTNPRQKSKQITYDSAGRLLTDADAAGGSTTLSRTDVPKGTITTSTTAMNYNPSTYAILQLTDDNGVQYECHENVAHDGSTNRTWVGKDGTTTAQAADGTLSVSVDGPDPRWGLQAPSTVNLTVTLPSGNQMTCASSKTVALSDVNDPLSLISETNSTTVNDQTFTSVYCFDGVNRTVTTMSPLGRSSMSTLDDNGRVIQSTVPEVAPVNYRYDSHGRLLTVSQSADGQTRTAAYTYDQTQNGGPSSGRLTAITDSLNRTTTFSYDPQLSGRVIQQTFPNGRFIQFQYDANGNLTGVTPPQKPEHLFDFNAVDMLDQYTPPVAPNTANNVTIYAYNVDRQLTNVTRPDGLKVNYTYDPHIGWLTNVNLPGGEDIDYTYIRNGCGCSGVGQPETVTFLAANYVSAIRYSYDGSLVTQVTWSGPVLGAVDAGYDNFFRVNSLSVNGANPVHFGYDADGLLVKAGDLILARDTLNGRLTGTTLDNVSDSWTYNGFGEAQSYIASANGNPLYTESFTRDNAGRIAIKTETIGGVTSICEYTYDSSRGWLTDVSSNGIPLVHYDYDDNGNRTHVIAFDREVTYAAADGQDRILSATETLPMQLPKNVSWTYSADGELQTKTVGGATTRYNYDVQGNLRQVSLADGTQIEYIVDPTGRRIGKTINNILKQGWLYQDSLKPIAELDGNGNVVSRFIYAGKANVPEYMVRNGTKYRLITDQIGSVRLVINASNGSTAQRIDYDEFGRVLNDSNPGFQPFGFAGGLYDVDTGLVHFGARDYDADSGRWTSKDVIGFAGGDFNLYGYVHSDPINRSDAFGLLDCAGLRAIISRMEGTIRSAIQSMGSGGDVQRVFQNAHRMRWIAAGGEVVQAMGTAAFLAGDLAAKAPVLFNQAGKQYVISARGLARAKGTSTYRYTVRRAIEKQENAGVETAVSEVGWDAGDEIVSGAASSATGFPVDILNEAEAVSEREVEMANDMSALTYNTIQRLQGQLAGILNAYHDCCK